MGDLTPLEHAQASVVGLAHAEQQLEIAGRARRLAAVRDTQGKLTEANTLRAFADELQSEVDISQVGTAAWARAGGQG